MNILSLFSFAYLFVAGDVFVSASPVAQQTDGKIINGDDAVPGSHPHIVTVQWTYFGLWFHICGGSVIADRFVLTAAHCVDFAPAQDFRVVVNEHRLYDIDGEEQVIAVRQIYLHDNWWPGLDIDDTIFPNDIAILQLTTDVVDKTAIIPMATSDDEDFAGVTCTISGWGINDTDASVPNTLQEVNMTVMSQTECSDFWKQLWPNDTLVMFNGQICIFNGEDPVTGASACSGDSGGPMVCNGVLAGVTSWGVQGCRDLDTKEFRPSVYARVSHYYPWIELVMGRFEIGRG